MTDAPQTAELWVKRPIWELTFQWKRLRVCVLCWWYLRHWPMHDLSTAEWRFQLDGETAWSAFLEGWVRGMEG